MNGTRAVGASAIEKDCFLWQKKMYKRKENCDIGYEVFTAVTLKRSVFGNVALCSQVEVR